MFFDLNADSKALLEKLKVAHELESVAITSLLSAMDAESTDRRTLIELSKRMESAGNEILSIRQQLNKHKLDV